MYGHHIAWYQWIGVISVYGGLALNVWTRYNNEGEKRKPLKVGLELETLTEASAVGLRPAGRRASAERGRGQLLRGGEGGVVSPVGTASVATQQNDDEEKALLLSGMRAATTVGHNGRNIR